MKKLSIVILNFNSKRYILDCLESIPTHKDWEILVPDNGSTDGSLEAIEKLYPKVKILENRGNVGFAAGNNVALRTVNSKYALLLNPDTIVYPHTIETLLDYMDKNPEVGAATCRVELPNGNLDYSCHRGFPTPESAVLHFLGLKSQSSYTASNISDDIHPIEVLTGAFALIRAKAGQEIGWLDEDYHWNGEDIDFCYKLHERGWKIMYIPSVKITHIKGHVSKASRESRKRWALNSTDAMALFYQKHLEKKHPFFVNWLVYLGIWGLRKFRWLTA